MLQRISYSSAASVETASVSKMNKFLIICLTIMLSVAAAVAIYPRYHGGGHKFHYLGGASYGHGYYKPKYTAHGLSYKKPAVHHATPIVYAHRSYSKPKVTHYVKPAHEVYHAPKPVYYLGGHSSHGVVYKPAVVYKPVVHHVPRYVHKGHY